LRLVSIAICLIAIAYFFAFAMDQSSDASNHQQAEVHAAEGGAPSDEAPKKESSVHKDIDKAFSTFASPFSGIVSGSKSQWTIHIVNTLVVLLVYGFGLGFVARLLRIGI
jgi:hypothetical protein